MNQIITTGPGFHFVSVWEPSSNPLQLESEPCPFIRRAICSACKPGSPRNPHCHICGAKSAERDHLEACQEIDEQAARIRELEAEIIRLGGTPPDAAEGGGT